LDLVYCRFLLIHLPEPQRALREMFTLLRPDGILVCEDGDLTASGSEPTSALNAFADLWGRLGPRRGLDYTLGRRLFQMVCAAGFPRPEITFNQPAVARGEQKRFLELSVAEAGPAFIGAGLITSSELERTLVEMRGLARDESVLAIMPRMAQVWARKPAQDGGCSASLSQTMVPVRPAPGRAEHGDPPAGRSSDGGARVISLFPGVLP
jgi:SAM-dependent methyltransferase